MQDTIDAIQSNLESGTPKSQAADRQSSELKRRRYATTFAALSYCSDTWSML